MKIDLNELETALLKMLAHARQVRGPIIELPDADDLYWLIHRPSLVDPTKNPAPEDVTLGCLGDDLEKMQEVASGKRDPLGYDLVWASALLRCLGDHTM